MEPMARAYRWETLRKLREEALDAAAAALAQAADERARQDAAVRTAQKRRQEAEARFGAERARAPEQRGAAFRGVDWQRARAFEKRLLDEVETRGRALGEARAGLLGAQQREEAAREALVEARRELEVLERDRARAEAEARRTGERREEAEAEDLAAARWKLD